MQRFIPGILFVLSVSFLPHGAWLCYLAAAALLAGATQLLKVQWKKVLKPILYFETFAVAIACLSLFQVNGLVIFVSLLVKSTLCISCMVFISSTTTFSEILEALERMKLPSLLVISLALTYRYLFLIKGEAQSLQRARRARTFSVSRFEIWKLLANDLAQLFIRTIGRGERIYGAMTSRGWRL